MIIWRVENDLKTAMERFEQAFRKYYIFISKDNDDYLDGHRDRSRLIKVLITRLLLFLYMLKWILVVILNENSEWIIFDFTKLMGKINLSRFALITLGLAIFEMSVSTTYQEVTNQLYIGEIFYLLKYGKIRYPLNAINLRRYSIKMNLLTSLILKTTVLYSFGIYRYYSIDNDIETSSKI